MERESQAPGALPHNLCHSCCRCSAQSLGPLCALPRQLKPAAFSGGLPLTTRSHLYPEGPGVDSLTSGQFSDNGWLAWGPACLHFCLKSEQLCGGVYAPEPRWDQAEARPHQSPCPYLALSPPASSLLSSNISLAKVPPISLLPRTGVQALPPGILAKDTLLPNLSGVLPREPG